MQKQEPMKYCADYPKCTIKIGGDPRPGIGHQVNTFQYTMTEEKWNKITEVFPHIQPLTLGLSFSCTKHQLEDELGCLICAACGKERLPSKSSIEAYLAMTHIQSSMVLEPEDHPSERCIVFLLGGTSADHGCVHKILDIMNAA